MQKTRKKVNGYKVLFFLFLSLVAIVKLNSMYVIHIRDEYRQEQRAKGRLRAKQQALLSESNRLRILNSDFPLLSKLKSKINGGNYNVR